MALWYREAFLRVVNKEIDWDTDQINVTLHTNTYVPNQDTHNFVDDLTNEIAATGGYSTGGVVLASKSQVYTAANSWAQQRAASTAYAVHFVVRPASANGFLYRATTAGTTGASLPTYPTVVGQTVVDGGVTWTNIGAGIVVIAAGNASWPAATFTGVRYAVLSDRTPGTAATQPLIGYVNFGSDQSGQGGAFTVQWDSQGIFQFFAP